MENDPKHNGKKAPACIHRFENALTRVPNGHMRTKEREFVLRMINSRITRQEGGRVPLQEYMGHLPHKL